MKKVLIVTYYWPPAGGPGVQRVLKFTKYLPQFGWQPIILTVKKGEFPSYDASLSRDIPDECIVIKTHSFEPNLLYKKWIGLKKNDSLPMALVSEKNLNWRKRISVWIRINFFLPDAKRLWKFFAVRKGRSIIRNFKPDLILSSSPPPTVHLIAQSLHKSSKIPWIADFRDPWTDIYHFDDINKNYIVRKIENKMERNVINNCNLVITVSEHFKKIFEQKINNNKKFIIITNGFDPADFKDLKYNKSPKFTLAYSGKLSVKQNPVKLWEGINNFFQKHPDTKKTFQISLTGKFDSTVHTSIKNNNLEDVFVDHGYVSHKEALQNILKADILLILIPDTKKNKGILPGKLFEYMAAQRYIIGIGPEDSDMAKILKDTNSGIVLPFSSDFTLVIKELYQKWERKVPLSLPNKGMINKYSRFELTKSLAFEMDKIVI